MLHEEYRKVNFAANIICKNCKERNTEECQKCHVEEIRASKRFALYSELVERDTIEAKELKTGYVIHFYDDVTDIVGEVMNISVDDDDELCCITVRHPEGIYKFKTDKHDGIEYYCRIDNGRNIQDFLLYGHDMNRGVLVYKYTFKTTIPCKMPTPFKSFDDILDFIETAVDETDNRLFEYETVREMRENHKIPAHTMKSIMNAILHKQIQQASLDDIKIECSSINTNDWSLELVCECTYDVVADTEENALRAATKKAEYHRSGIKNIQFGYPRMFTLTDTTFITNQFI